MRFELSGKTALVTGGGSGIGHAVALDLARERIAVAIMGRSHERLVETEKEMRAYGASATLTVSGDVSRGDDVEEAVGRTEAMFGRIDLLVNCAGITRPAWAVDMTEAQFDEVLSVNTKGTFLCCQSVGRGMLSRRSGAIVNVASINALGGQSGRINYTASKAALLGITRTLAIEWGRFGVRVNAVAPQLIDTPMIHKNVPPTFIHDVVRDRTPLGRLGRPEEVSAVILFLLSNGASYLTGTTVIIDGGLQAGFLTSECGADAGFNTSGSR